MIITIVIIFMSSAALFYTLMMMLSYPSANQERRERLERHIKAQIKDLEMGMIREIKKLPEDFPFRK